MDPLGFVDGPSLYRAYFVPSGIDPTGKLRLRLHELTTGKCGEFSHVAKWDLGNGESTGYVVQKVCTTYLIKDCDHNNSDCGRNVGGKNERECTGSCYLEIWEFKNGVGSNDDGKFDTFGLPSCGETYGFMLKRGQAFFVTLNWLKENNLIDEIDRFKRGKDGVKGAKDLRSACMEDVGIENFWNTAFAQFGSKGTERCSQVIWDCCCKKKKPDSLISKLNRCLWKSS